MRFPFSSFRRVVSADRYLTRLGQVEVARWIEALRQNVEFARGEKNIGDGLTRSVSLQSTRSRNPQSSSATSIDGASFDDQDSLMGDNDASGNLPRSDDFDLLATSASAQLDLTEQLLRSINSGDNEDVMTAVKGSLSSCRQFLAEFVDVAAQRERHLKRQLSRENEVKKLWENNMKELASSHSLMEEELAKIGKDNIRKKRALQEVRATLLVSPISSPTKIDGGRTPERIRAASGFESIQVDDLSAAPRISISSDVTRTRNGRMRGATIIQPLNPVELESLVISALDGDADVDSEDDEDEFFEAIESGVIPLDDESASTAAKGGKRDGTEHAQAYVDTLDVIPYKGYEHLREKLPIESDNRRKFCS